MKDFYIHDYQHFQIIQTPNLWKTYQNYNYMLAKSGKAVVIDPGDYKPIRKTLKSNNLSVEKIVLTHHHPDHVGAVEKLKKEFNCDVWGFQKDRLRLPGITQTFQDGESLAMAGEFFEIIHCPGHTLGLCTLYNARKNILFSNDLLFSLGCGRVFEGNMVEMYNSLQKVARLPIETQVFCSHEYTLSNLKFALKTFPKDSLLGLVADEILAKVEKGIPTVPSSLGFEKKYNPFLRCWDPGLKEALNMNDASESEVFAEMRARKDNFKI